MKKNKIALIITGGTIVGSLLLSSTAFAYTPMSGGKRNAIVFDNKHLPDIVPMRPAIVGKVTGIEGNMIYISDYSGIIHTVDASNASITKAGNRNTVSLSLSNVGVGDVVAVGGNKEGQTLAMHKINTLLFTDKAAGANDRMSETKSTTTRKFGGIITSVDGESFTISGFNMSPQNGWNKLSDVSTTSYTVTVKNTTVFMKDGMLDSLINLKINDKIVVIGTLDKETNKISAFGVNVITKPRQGMK